jgi:ATP-binding cassette subfamily C protein CydD
MSVQRVFQMVETDRNRIEVIPQSYLRCLEIHVRNWVANLPDSSRLTYPNFDIKSGEVLCVVGPNGAGKSSLLDSLAGHLSSSGQLFVDGSLVLPDDPRWRETCALVRQEPELVPGKLFDNLWGFPGWKETPVLAHAIDQVICKRRPENNVTEVGIDDKGISVGQRRAIAVLRALGSSAQVLLLDEPVAAVDEMVVRSITEAIAETCQEGRIVVVTAHEHDLKRLDLKWARILRLAPHL